MTQQFANLFKLLSKIQYAKFNLIQRIQIKKPMEQQNSLSNLKTGLATDLTTLSNLLKKQSQQLYEITIKVLQEALLMDYNNCLPILSKLLSHLLHVLQVKCLTSNVLSILSRIIAFLGVYKTNQTDKIDQILYHTIDTLALLMKQREKSKLLEYKSNNEKAQLSLRIIQNVFTLINQSLLFHMEHNLLIRLYSICFQCCVGDPIVQNIAVSALFTMTQSLFDGQNNKKIDEAFPILQCFLAHLFEGKKFNWMKNVQLKGLVWDLITICVKGSSKKILKLPVDCPIHKNLKTMYEIAVQHVFSSGQGSIFTTNSDKKISSKNKDIASVSLKKGSLVDFIRFYRAFVFFSICLWINPVKQGNEGLVPFNHYMGSLNEICQLKQLTSKVYIILQGVCLLLLSNHSLPVSTQKGVTLVEILAKISEQVYVHCQFSQISNWDSNYQYYLEKLCGEFGKINQTDYIKLLRHTLISFRKKYSLDQSLNSIHPSSYKQRSGDSQQPIMTDRSNLSSVSDLQQLVLNESKSSNKNRLSKRKWERLIQLIIHIIRCLTSISLVKNDKNKKSKKVEKEKEKISQKSDKQKSKSETPRQQKTSEGPSRSVLQLLLQLQHWFILTPSSRIRNLILEELLTTVVQIQSKIKTASSFQFQKMCQCVQIGSNLMYGYYECINASGFTILLKMMASVHSTIQEGHGVQQLQEVMEMVDRLYNDQKLMKTQAVFSVTAQGFIQCVSSIIADFQQQSMAQDSNSKQKSNKALNQKRNSKMIQYVLQKFMKVIVNNYRHLQKEWSFLTAFFITLCLNKNDFIKSLGFSLIKPLVFDLLRQQIVQSKQLLKETEQTEQSKLHTLRQDQIIGLYVQLSRSNEITTEFLQQIRQILPMLTVQKAIIQIFKIVSNLSTSKSSYKKQLVISIKEMQEMIIKQFLFKIKEVENLKSIISSFAINFSDKQIESKMTEAESNVKNNDEYQLISLLWAVADHIKTISKEKDDEISVQESVQKYSQLWSLIFSKFHILSHNSKNLQFKQSVLHSLTQIIGQNAYLINTSVIVITIENIYMPLIYDLMELDSILEFKDQLNQEKCQQRIDMTKISIKNYLKIIKKLIAQSILTSQTTKKTCVMDQLNAKIIRFLQQNMNLNRQKQYKKYQEMINDDYLCELCVYIDLTISQASVMELIDQKKIGQLIFTIEQTMSTIDKQSLCYRKRLKPIFDKVKAKMDQLKKQSSSPVN